MVLMKQQEQEKAIKTSPRNGFTNKLQIRLGGLDVENKMLTDIKIVLVYL